MQAAAQGLGLPVMVADDEVAGTYNILHRYLFDRREDLQLPTAFLVSAKGEIVKVYTSPAAVAQVVAGRREDRGAARPNAWRGPSLSRHVLREPGRAQLFPVRAGAFRAGVRTRRRWWRSSTWQRSDPSAITFYNLGTLYMKGGRPSQAKAAFERALQLKPDYAEANNSLGALLAQSGDVPAAIERFRAALQAKPDFADALNNLGFALFQTGRARSGLRALSEGAGAATRLPGGAQQPRHLLRPPGRSRSRADVTFSRPSTSAATTARPPTTWRSCWRRAARRTRPSAVLQRLLKENPAFEMAYVTLCRLYLKGGPAPGRRADSGAAAAEEPDAPDRSPAAPGDPGWRLMCGWRRSDQR